MNTNPFAYGFQEESGFKSFYDQRKPTRSDVCETAFNPTEVETFMTQGEAPSPNIANITGYSALDKDEETQEIETAQENIIDETVDSEVDLNEDVPVETTTADNE